MLIYNYPETEFLIQPIVFGAIVLMAHSLKLLGLNK